MSTESTSYSLVRAELSSPPPQPTSSTRAPGRRYRRRAALRISERPATHQWSGWSAACSAKLNPGVGRRTVRSGLIAEIELNQSSQSPAAGSSTANRKPGWPYQPGCAASDQTSDSPGPVSSHAVNAAATSERSPVLRPRTKRKSSEGSSTTRCAGQSSVEMSGMAARKSDPTASRSEPPRRPRQAVIPTTAALTAMIPARNSGSTTWPSA